jgi:hypothetical protein
MQKGTALIKKAKGELLYFADVEPSVESSSDTLHVEFACSGKGFTSQGYFEDASAVGYDDWKNGSRVGATFALSIAGRPAATVVVNRITGLGTDTNPTIVAVAAAQAVWSALGFVPSDEIARSLEAKMFGNFGRGPDHVPEL